MLAKIDIARRLRLPRAQHQALLGKDSISLAHERPDPIYVRLLVSQCRRPLRVNSIRSGVTERRKESVDFCDLSFALNERRHVRGSSDFLDVLGHHSQ